MMFQGLPWMLWIFSEIYPLWSEFSGSQPLRALRMLSSPLAWSLCFTISRYILVHMQPNNQDNTCIDFWRSFCSSVLPAGLIHKFQPLKHPSVSSTEQDPCALFEFSLLLPSWKLPSGRIGLVWFVSLLSGMCLVLPAVHCLKTVVYIFCPVFQFFMAGGQVQHQLLRHYFWHNS